MVQQFGIIIMLEGKRFKFQHTNISQEQICQYNNTLQLNSFLQRSQRARSASRKKQTACSKIKRLSLKHYNPQETIEQENQRKSKDKVRLERARKKRMSTKILNSNSGFQLKIKQSKQKGEITSIIRIIVIDWLMQITHQLSLQKQALHYSIHYLDQLLHKTIITKQMLQVYALCCLMIAQKLESRANLTPHHASQLLKGEVSEKEFVRLQLQIIGLLDFKLYPFNLWVEVNILLKAFESYFKCQLGDQWLAYRRRILWITQGIVLQNSYFDRKMISKDISMSILYLIVHQFKPNIVKYLLPFYSSLTGEKKVEIQQMRNELQYVSTWVGRRCKCVQQYDESSYHCELRVMGASRLYN